MELITPDMCCDIAEQDSLSFKAILNSADEIEHLAFDLVMQSVYRRIISAAREGDYSVYLPIELFTRSERAVRGFRGASVIGKKVQNELFVKGFRCNDRLNADFLHVSWGSMKY